MTQKFRIKLKSYDHKLIDKSAEKIVQAIKATKAVISGPIPLPMKKEVYTVLRAPHVYKESREQYKLCTYKRLPQNPKTPLENIVFFVGNKKLISFVVPRRPREFCHRSCRR